MMMMSFSNSFRFFSRLTKLINEINKKYTQKMSFFLKFFFALSIVFNFFHSKINKKESIVHALYSFEFEWVIFLQVYYIIYI